MWSILKLVSRIAPCMFECGEVKITKSGEYEVETGFTPTSVWLDVGDAKHRGVCHAEPDGFDVHIVPDGLVIVARLQSKRRRVRWLAQRGI